MKLVAVEELFEVQYGTSLELNALDEVADGIPFVSRTAQNNGVSAKVAPIAGVEPLPAGVLSVALGGTPLATFLQESPFYTGRDVAVLTPKASMPRRTLLYYAACLQSNRYRFSYGRQANRSLASLAVPDLASVPKWVSSTCETPDTVWHNILHGGLRLGEADSSVRLQAKNWASFALGELFEIHKGRRLTKDEMTAGRTLYVGATEGNNGITERIGQSPLHPGGQITVSYDGSIGEAFYQPEPFWASDAVNVLYPRFAMTPEVALFFVTLIRLEKYRYNYGRKWRLEVMRATKVRLPVKDDGKPDFEAMAAVIGRCPSDALLPSFVQRAASG
jgi:hypothetical protein